MYVNPEAAAAQSVAIQQQQNEAVELLTQTVYGFLDFTTTIGNTVMVFSPQSALAGTKIKGAPSIRLPQTHAPNELKKKRTNQKTQYESKFSIIFALEVTCLNPWTNKYWREGPPTIFCRKRQTLPRIQLNYRQCGVLFQKETVGWNISPFQ